MNMHWFPRRIRTLTLAFLLALFIPLIFKSPVLLHIIILLSVWIILTESLNFVTGFAGQLAFGHSAFITLGAYCGAVLMVNFKTSFWLGLLVGGLFAFFSGLILGLMAMRLRGDYLGMVTLGFAEIIRIYSINLVSITRGPAGLSGIPHPSLFGYVFHGEIPYFYLILILMAIIHITIERLLFSHFGRACLAMRDDEIAAQSMGVESYKYKVWAFCITSGMAGLVGVFYASWTTVYTPNSFTITDSIMISVMNTLGGIGSLTGAIPGAIIIGGLPELLRPFTSGVQIASLRLAGVGLLMMIIMIIRPQGVSGMSIRKGYISLEPIRKWFVREDSGKEGTNHE
jgi:branched-chain amino acid transport system permease protein